MGANLFKGLLFMALLAGSGAASAQGSVAPCPLEQYRVPAWVKDRKAFSAELEADLKVAWQGAEPDLGLAILCAGAAAGLPRAQLLLGGAAKEGKLGVKKDLVQARAWFERAAAGGDSQAQFALSTMLMAGEGGPIRIAQGMDLLRAAAQNGVADAQTLYGLELYLGRYVKRDLNGALAWLRRAASTGHENAARALQELAREGIQ